MQPNEIAEVLNRPLGRPRRGRKLIDFETTVPSAVEELIRQRDERRRA